MGPSKGLYYCRTSTGSEVDFILGQMEVAIEMKSSARVDSAHAKGLRAIGESHTLKRKILVSFETETKKFSGGIECWHWRDFLDQLWAGEIC